MVRTLRVRSFSFTIIQLHAQSPQHLYTHKRMRTRHKSKIIHETLTEARQNAGKKKFTQTE